MFIRTLFLNSEVNQKTENSFFEQAVGSFLSTLPRINFFDFLGRNYDYLNISNCGFNNFAMDYRSPLQN